MTRTPVAPSALFLCAVALAVVGCDCRPGSGIKQTYGEIGVVWRDAAGERFINRDALYDFGNALVGEKKPLTLTVRNVGANRLTLSKLERTEGDEVTVGAAVVVDAPFEVVFDRTDIGASEQAEFQMYFSPKALKGTFETKLALTAEGARPEDSIAVITLRGTGEKGACDLPTVIDFGKVPVGETLTYELPMVNPTSVDATGLAQDITGADATSFGYAASSPRGQVPVPAHSTVNVVFTFAPTEKRLYEAHVQVAGAGACPAQDVLIKGEGSDDVLTWAPVDLNFGYVSPTFENVKDVVFVNLSNVPIRLTGVVSSLPSDFSHRVPAGSDPTVFVVPGGGVSTPLHIAFAPSGLGPKTGTLTFQTGLNRTPTGVINLRGVGGGPKIRVTPRPTLAFGRVGYFPGTTTFSVLRKVNVQNVGVRPPTPDPTTHLFLGQVDPVSGLPGNLPLFEVAPKNAATDPTEFTVTLASPYSGVNGIEPVAGSNFVDLGVTLTPKSVGLKEAELVIYSNDSAEPEVHITITADVQALPPCNYRVSPALANFGLVTPPNSKDLPIDITNLGAAQTDVCYLSGIDLAAGSHPAYSIVGGPIVERELQPLETLQVVVRVQPTGAVPTTLVTLTGALIFNVTSPTAPQGSVQLRTAVGPACLVITPDPLDFGTVRQSCNSAPRTFNIYNTCTTPITVNGFSMQAAGGQAPGGPQCPGTSACPEFFLTQTPTIPTNGLVITQGSAPVTFQAKYAPIDIGSDQGAVAINAVQSGQSITYLVALQGTGDAIGQQTDTFQQDAQPKADILLVVDDSGSMQDKQTNLANNFASFIQYAVSANVDYQLGITTTTNSLQDCIPGFGCVPVNSRAAAGQLFRDANTPYILTPTTPNVAQKFANAVNVGTNGSGTETGLETAVLALTPPMISSDNAGFVRTDANLAVVVVSDAGDQSAQPVSYYQNRLLNVKGFNRLSMFTFSNIGPYLSQGPVGCEYDGGGDVVRYQSVVNYTSGVRDEICTTNWAAALQGLGRTAFGFRTQFYLNNVPDTSGGRVIEVKINGAVVPAANWSYDAASNSIRFTPTTTPGPGQTLTITYFTACF